MNIELYDCIMMSTGEKKQNKFLNVIVGVKTIFQWNRRGSSVVRSIYFSLERTWVWFPVCTWDGSKVLITLAPLELTPYHGLCEQLDIYAHTHHK